MIKYINLILNATKSTLWLDFLLRIIAITVFILWFFVEWSPCHWYCFVVYIGHFSATLVNVLTIVPWLFLSYGWASWIHASFEWIVASSEWGLVVRCSAGSIAEIMVVATRSEKVVDSPQQREHLGLKSSRSAPIRCRLQTVCICHLAIFTRGINWQKAFLWSKSLN